MDSFAEPLKIAELMADFQKPWLVAGGWAIDLYLGRVTRTHRDIEIVVLRRDQSSLQDYLNGWDLRKVIPHTSGPMATWHQGEWLELPVHEIHARYAGNAASAFEILLNESSGDTWRFRRNPKIVRPLSKLGLFSEHRIPFMRPEIVLLYKAKNPTIDDQVDFNNVRKVLKQEPRRWLKQTMETYYPGHTWLAKL